MLKNLHSNLEEKWITGKRKGSPSNLRKWTIPEVNYVYKEIPYVGINGDYGVKENDYKLVRSSIIPIINMDGENYWLLGSFHDYVGIGDPILTDFGGRKEKKTETALDCALRELKEESKGLLTVPVLDALNYKDSLFPKSKPQNNKGQNNKKSLSVRERKVTVFEGRDDENKQKIFFFIVVLNYNDVKDIPKKFEKMPYLTKEKLGPINFYPQNAIRSRGLRTSKNLTDFVSYLNQYRC